MAERLALGSASALVIGLCLALAGSAEAATATATLTVTATVQNGCSIENASLNFGTYTVGQNTDLDASGTIRVLNCQGVQVSIALDGGSSGNVNNRQMANGANRLNYQLYTDPARSQIWGTGQNAASMQIIQNPASIPVYGRIPRGQNVPSGTYSDTVTITMTF
jgi:spore coat protein U-like protein